MLNKIKVIGKILPFESKERNEMWKENPIIYFSLLVINPNNSSTILRCLAYGEIATKIKSEARGEEVVEISGHLKNERVGRQILVKVQEFTKLELDFEAVDFENSNQVQLRGKAVDFKFQPNQENPENLSFQIMLPYKRNMLVGFFCRVQGELVPKISSQLKESQEVLVEGFLQTKKIVENEGRIQRVSHVICQSFALAKDNSVDAFDNPDKLT